MLNIFKLGYFPDHGGYTAQDPLRVRLRRTGDARAYFDYGSPDASTLPYLSYWTALFPNRKGSNVPANEEAKQKLNQLA